MPADLKQPFNPSCCDGGCGPNDMSAQPCGCDRGEEHLCQRHEAEKLPLYIRTLRDIAEMNPGITKERLLSLFEAVSPIGIVKAVREAAEEIVRGGI